MGKDRQDIHYQAEKVVLDYTIRESRSVLEKIQALRAGGYSVEELKQTPEFKEAQAWVDWTTKGGKL